MTATPICRVSQSTLSAFDLKYHFIARNAEEKNHFSMYHDPNPTPFLFKLLSAVIFKAYSLSPAFYHLNSLVTTKTVKTEFSCMMITDFHLHLH